MTTDQFNSKLRQLSLSHEAVGEMFLLGGTELVSRWAEGKEAIPPYVEHVLGIVEEQRQWRSAR